MPRRTYFSSGGLMSLKNSQYVTSPIAKIIPDSKGGNMGDIPRRYPPMEGPAVMVNRRARAHAVEG